MPNPTQRQRPSVSHRWIDARVRSKHRPDVPAIISNISEAGCCIEAAAQFREGEQVDIMVPRLGSISATVRWSQAGHSGAVFLAGSDQRLIPDPEAAKYQSNIVAEAAGPHVG
jgi:hypothetical protein